MPLTLPETLSPVEAVWVLGAGLSWLLGCWALWDAWLDDRAMRGRVPDATERRRVVSRGALRRECLRLAKQSLLLIAGLTAASTVNGPLSDPANWKSYVISGCFALISLLFGITTLADRQDRRVVHHRRPPPHTA